MRFFKVTNKEECHHGFQYRDGLNIDTVPFRSTGSCVAGGLYFTDSESIASFYDCGVWVREVHLPRGHQKFQVDKDPAERCSKWRASCIILGRRVSIFDAVGCRSIGAPIMSMDQASRRGSVAILEWWKSSKLQVEYTESAMTWATMFAHLTVLNWWKNSGLKLKYNNDAIDIASRYGELHALEWWRSSGLELRYSNQAIDLVSKYDNDGNVAVLEWWKQSGINMKYTVDAMDLASYYNQLAVLDWWKNSGLELKYTEFAINNASRNGHVNILEWWKKSNLRLKYNKDAYAWWVDWTHANKMTEWWKSSGLMLDV